MANEKQKNSTQIVIAIIAAVATIIAAVIGYLATTSNKKNNSEIATPTTRLDTFNFAKTEINTPSHSRMTVRHSQDTSSDHSKKNTTQTQNNYGNNNNNIQEVNGNVNISK